MGKYNSYSLFYIFEIAISSEEILVVRKDNPANTDSSTLFCNRWIFRKGSIDKTKGWDSIKIIPRDKTIPECKVAVPNRGERQFRQEIQDFMKENDKNKGAATAKYDYYQEDNPTKKSSSTYVTGYGTGSSSGAGKIIGGAIAGGIIAGPAGAIVGGLVGHNSAKKK